MVEDKKETGEEKPKATRKRRAAAPKAPKAKKQSMISLVQKSVMKASRERFGVERACVGGDHKRRQFGVEIPALALQYLVALNVWPLQRITQSQGEQYTCKSAFIFQLHKWFLDAGGYVIHIDTENKTSVSLQPAILGNDLFFEPVLDKAGEPVLDDKGFPTFVGNPLLQMYPLSTVNDWQVQVTESIKDIKAIAKEQLKNRPAHLRKVDFPTLITIDSMMGTRTNEAAKYVEKTGEGQGRTFSDAPLLIANYMRDLPDRLVGWPITVHFSHHELADVSKPGSHRHAGGKAVDFRATFDLRFVLGAKTFKPDGTYGGSKKDYKGVGSRAGVEGKYISITPTKNSEGPNVKRVINVPFIWNYVEAPELEAGFKQVAWWDWDEALTDLLVSKQKELAHIMDVNKGKCGRCVGYWSASLGMTSKDAVESHTFGRMVEETPALRKALSREFGIEHITPFHGDMWKEVYGE